MNLRQLKWLKSRGWLYNYGRSGVEIAYSEANSQKDFTMHFYVVFW